MGVAVWPMIELEADDALASASRIASEDPRVEKICIWTPDKDLAQCVRGDRVVQIDRRGNKIRDAKGVREKFGVDPILIPDYLALVGDPPPPSPGTPPPAPAAPARPPNRYGAVVFKDVATLRTEAALFRDVDELRWRGPTGAFAALTQRMEAPRLLERSLKAQAALDR